MPGPWPARTCAFRPVDASQMPIGQVEAQAASQRPSGDQASAVTWSSSDDRQRADIFAMAVGFGLFGIFFMAILCLRDNRFERTSAWPDPPMERGQRQGRPRACSQAIAGSRPHRGTEER